jgi:integrase
MARRLKANAMPKRDLPYVHRYRDRHGKLRVYVKPPGRPSAALPGAPGSPEYMQVYQAAMAGDVVPKALSTAKGGTLAALVQQFYRSAEFANIKPTSQSLYRRVLKPIIARHGHRFFHDLPHEKARKIIEEIGEHKPGMANLTKAVLQQLFNYAKAVDPRLRGANPFDEIPRYRLGTIHTWTDDEIAAFEKRWPLGTPERLAFAVLLYTGQRGIDVVKMRRSDIPHGAIRVVQRKTAIDADDEMLIAIHPALARAIKAGPSKGLFLIGDESGRPISRPDLTKLIRRAADAAGLPANCVAHGLRKAALRRLAEHGSTTKEIAAVSGHRSLSEIERYTRRADQARLARAALKRLPDKK